MKKEKSGFCISKHIVVFIVCLLICITSYFIFKEAILVKVKKEQVASFINIVSKTPGKLADFFSVLFSLYLAVAVFFATSRTPLSDYIVKKNNVDELSEIIGFSMLYCLTYVLLEAIIPENSIAWLSILMIIALFSIIYNVVFDYILIMSFKTNMIRIKEQADSEEKYRNRVENNLSEIEHSLYEINKKIK